MWTKTGSKNPVIQNEYLACTFLYKHSKAQQTFAKFVKGAPMGTTYLGSAMGVTQDIDGSYKMGCQNKIIISRVLLALSTFCLKVMKSLQRLIYSGKCLVERHLFFTTKKHPLLILGSTFIGINVYVKFRELEKRSTPL